MATDDGWCDPAHPPVDATDLGDGVWVSWGTSLNEGDHPLIWHWCTRANWNARRPDDPTPPGWMPAGVKKHTLVSRDPLHLEPSLYWPDCCGLHGFVRDGRWASV